MKLLSITHQLIKTCSCKALNGCPCCIISPRCGSMNEPLDKEGALFILEKLLEYKELTKEEDWDEDEDWEDEDEDEDWEDEDEDEDWDDDEYYESQYFEGPFGSPKRVDHNRDLSIKCHKCGSKMELIHGKKGAFIGCTAWSQTGCDFKFDWNKKGEQEKLKCPICNRDLEVKIGKNGKFLGCSGFPACNFSFSLER